MIKNSANPLIAIVANTGLFVSLLAAVYVAIMTGVGLTNLKSANAYITISVLVSSVVINIYLSRSKEVSKRSCTLVAISVILSLVILSPIVYVVFNLGAN
jgi:hypothetical protein